MHLWKTNVRFVVTEKLIKIINDKKAPDSIDVSLVRVTAIGSDGRPLPPQDSPALLEIATMRLEGSDDPVM